MGMCSSIAKLLQILHRELLHLVRGVSRFEVRSQRPTLDGLGQDDGGLPLTFVAASYAAYILR